MKKLVECPNCGHKFEINIDNQTNELAIQKEINKAVEAAKNETIKQQQLLLENEIKRIDAEYKNKITELNATIRNQQDKANLEKQNAVHIKENEISKLKQEYEILKNNEKNLQDQIKNRLEHDLNKEKDKFFKEYNQQLEVKNDKIKNLEHDLEQAKEKYKHSGASKALGEDLEQWCLQEWEKVRAWGFENAKFEKDNDASSGSKGDFIFRDYFESEPGKLEPYISIMYEMKNEEEGSNNKNEKFYKKLDSDRERKGCDYAILVSNLELKNPTFDGIYQVPSYKNMYVVRPANFMAVTAFLRNISRSLIDEKKKAISIRNQNINLYQFVNRFEERKDAFTKNFQTWGNYYQKAIEDIDKSIKNLQNMRDHLATCNKQIGSANKKITELNLIKISKDLGEFGIKMKDAVNLHNSSTVEIQETKDEEDDK